MAITYDPSSNTITVTGYTESSPCAFQDIYDADKAGTLTLVDRDGITAADTDPVDNTYNLRPADEKLMGGAKNDLYIIVENWNATSATIQLIGTDENDATLTEDIAITGNGTYYASNLFKTLTQTQVTAFTGTSFDYDLTQGQWGVVSKQCDNQFCFNCKLVIGDGSTVTWFGDNNKQIIFKHGIVSANWEYYIHTKANATAIFGRLRNLANKATDLGCAFMFLETSYHTYGIWNDGTVYLYSNMWSSISDAKVVYIADPDRVWNSIFHTWVVVRCGDTDVYNYQSHDGVNSGIFAIAGTATYNKIFILSQDLVYGLYFAEANNTFRNVNIIGTVTYDIMLDAVVGGASYIIDSILSSDDWTFYRTSTSTAYVYRQYSFDLKVIDKDNTPIDGATVKIWDKDSNLIVDTTTDANGVIATQTISRGYYNQANGDTLQEYSPHLIKVEKAGYTTYEADFTLEEKTDWTIALQGVLKRNPAMTGGMV